MLMYLAWVVGWCEGAGRPTILITVGQGPSALAVGAGGGCLDIFTLIYPFSSLSSSLWETARYSLDLKRQYEHLIPNGRPCWPSVICISG